MSRPPPTGDRLAAALSRRAPLARRVDLTAYRLVNGVGDGFAPGLTVDRFADVLIVSAEAPADADAVVQQLARQLEPRAIYAKTRPRAASRVTVAERDELAPSRPVLGEPVDQIVVREHGVRYEIRPQAGLSVGLFLDMRDVRRWLRDQSAGRHALNLFAYTCGFGVVASLGGAARVLNIDASRAYLNWGRRNYELNALPAEPHDFVYGDAFDWLVRLARRDQRFDLVILDPPSFGRTRLGSFSAARDYERLVASSARLLSRTGILVAATNHRGISARRFNEMIDQGLAAAHRSSRRLGGWHEPALDFPLAPGLRPYLKVVAHELA